jgi:hypothetical protein
VWSLAVATALAASTAFYSHSGSVAFADDHIHNPRIHHAIEALRDAQAELKDARHDFHGKKKDAMEAIQHAIDRLDEIKDYED